MPPESAWVQGCGNWSGPLCAYQSPARGLTEEQSTMKRSTERILTTHTGSLPRPPDLSATLEALDAGTTPDPTAFDARVQRAVAEIVRQQVDAGVDIINDGEQGKVGYSTYVRHRLTGFGGQSRVPMRADWADFPEA